MHHRGDRLGRWNDGEAKEVTEGTWIDGEEMAADGMEAGATEVEDGIDGEEDGGGEEGWADGGEAVVVAEVEIGEIGGADQRV